MAVLNITIPDAILPEVREAFDWSYPGRIVAGRTQGQWINDKTSQFIKDVHKAFKVAKVGEDARKTADSAYIEPIIT